MLYLDNDVYQLGFYVSTPGEKSGLSAQGPKIGLPVAFLGLERLYCEI